MEAGKLNIKIGRILKGCGNFLNLRSEKYTIKYCKEKAREKRLKYDLLTKTVEELESKLNVKCDSKVIDDFYTAKAELDDYLSNKTQGSIIRSKAVWHEQGEKCNKFFLGLEKRNKSKSTIKKLRISEKDVTDPKEIMSEIRNFYKEKYSEKIKKTPQECCEFLETVSLPSLTPEEAEPCGTLLTSEEVFNALNEMQNNKTPGNDGLPREFFVCFFDLVKTDLLNCLNQCWETGELTYSQSQAIVTLVEKPNKDTRLLKSWRPISLLNTDLKLISKVLANRIQNVLPSLISENQSAFVKGRCIGDPIRLISDILHETECKGIPAIIFAADFEAAFDSVHHALIFETMKKFGFTDDFIKWIKLLHKNTKSCIINNGFSTGYFTLNRGTRQGDPLSPYIFILVVEVLAAMVRQNKEIKGLTFGNFEIKQCLFADDITYFLKDYDSFLTLEDTISIFTDFSSLKVNFEKSEVAWIGSKKFSDAPVDGVKWINLTKEVVRILGIYFTYNKSLSNEYNFTRVKENIKVVLNIWKSRNLTIMGKNTIIKNLVLPKVSYVTSFLKEPKDFVKEIQGLLIKFLWHGGKSKIKYSALLKDQKEGGLKFPDLQTKIDTQRIMLVKRLLIDSNSSWTAIPNCYLKQIGGSQTIRTNFDTSNIPRSTPLFYKTCLMCWAKFAFVKPVSENEIANECLWNNVYIKNKFPCMFVDEMLSRGFHCVGELFGKNGYIKSLEQILNDNANSPLYSKYFLYWAKLIKSLPKNYVKTMNQLNCNYVKFDKNLIMYGENNVQVNIHEISSKLVYSVLIKKMCQESIAETHFNKK